MTKGEAIEELKLFKESAIPWDVPILLTAIDMAIEALQTPPISQRSMYQAGYRQAQEDRPRGEWVEETSWKYKKGGRNSDMKEILGTEWMTMIRQRCSECNMVTMVDDSILYKYCPHCGAVMRSE